MLSVRRLFAAGVVADGTIAADVEHVDHGALVALSAVRLPGRAERFCANSVPARTVGTNEWRFVAFPYARRMPDPLIPGALNMKTLIVSPRTDRTGDEAGQGLAEYALILALIAVVAIIALIFLGGQVSTILSTVGSSI